jgi:hypothetical protein
VAHEPELWIYPALLIVKPPYTEIGRVLPFFTSIWYSLDFITILRVAKEKQSFIFVICPFTLSALQMNRENHQITIAISSWGSFLLLKWRFGVGK